MTGELARKTNQAFYYLISITAVFMGLFGFLIVKFSQKIYIYSGIVIHQLRTACDCPAMAKFNDHPFIFTTLGIVGSMILFFIAFAIYRFFRLLIQTRKYVNEYLNRAKRNHSVKLKSVLVALDLHPKRIIEISGSGAVVFCFGILKSKIIISRGLVDLLSTEELMSVLRHENYHLTSREPLKLFILKYFQNVFFFLPGMKSYLKKYITFSELAADEQATDNFTSRRALAGALLKITDRQEQTLKTGLALSYFSSMMAERVDCLSAENYQPKFGFLRREFFLGIFMVIIGAMLSFVFLARSNQVLAMNDITACTGSQTSVQTEMTCHQANAAYLSGGTCHMR